MCHGILITQVRIAIELPTSWFNFVHVRNLSLKFLRSTLVIRVNLLHPFSDWWGLTRPKQLSMATTARLIWLCACVRYWPDCGLVFERVTCFYCYYFQVSFDLELILQVTKMIQNVVTLLLISGATSRYFIISHSSRTNLFLNSS